MNRNIVIPLGVGLTAFFLFKALTPERRVIVADIPFTDADVEAVARMLLAETDFARDCDEMAQIIWVAINRAKNSGNTLSEVVNPPGRPNWNGHSSYRDRFYKDWGAQRFEATKAFVEAVLTGNPAVTSRGPCEPKVFSNMIGTRAFFLHPTGMPTCDNVGGECGNSRVCTQTFAGPRCLPIWNVDATSAQGVLTVGKARFS
jgi:hypothetical protein